MEGLDRVKQWIGQIIELGLLLVPLGIVLQVLFGRPIEFITGDIVANLIALIRLLGENGIVGLIALVIILWLFAKRTLAADVERGAAEGGGRAGGFGEGGPGEQG